MLQSLQRIESDRVGGEQIGEINSNAARRSGAGASQFVHLRGIQPAGKVNRAAVGPLLHLDAAFHDSSSEQAWHQRQLRLSREFLRRHSPRLVSLTITRHNIR